MGLLILVILVTIGLTKKPEAYEIRILKETFKKCIKASKNYKFSFKDIYKVISIKTRC